MGGGYFSGQKMEIPGRRGAYVKFPPWWGYESFLELHNKLKMQPNQIQSTKLGVYLNHPALQAATILVAMASGKIFGDQNSGESRVMATMSQLKVAKRRLFEKVSLER